MKRIYLLDPLVANQIAAGEVVERPASVIKELVENAMDASATRIEIEIEGGGIHLIRVRDNGHGITKDDLPLAFSRHATSKIQTTDDLAAIESLGFRGEALASIVSVAKCRLITKTAESKEAWQIEIHPNLRSTVSLAAHAVGTTIEVADLFYNTPVRRKFLKSEKSETLAIEEMIKRLALANSNIDFIFKNNQKIIRQYHAASDKEGQHARIGKICGYSFVEHAKQVDFDNGPLRLTGWMANASFVKRHADCQYLFVNGRMIRDKIINHAIKQCYQLQPNYVEGSYPAYILFLTLDPMEVDVNVHPTKQEVRFSQTRWVHDFIHKAVQEAFEHSERVFELHSIPVSHTPKKSSPANVLPTELPLIPVPEKHPSLTAQSLNTSVINKGERYWIIEEKEGIRIIDLNGVKNIIFDAVLSKQGNYTSRLLLFPLRLSFPKKLSDFEREQWRENFRIFGFMFRVDHSYITILKQPIYLEKPLSHEQGSELLESLLTDPSFESFKKCLYSWFSTKQLPDWPEWDALCQTLPSTFLSHDKIASIKCC